MLLSMLSLSSFNHHSAQYSSHSHWLLHHITIVETMNNSEGGLNLVAMTIINLVAMTIINLVAMTIINLVAMTIINLVAMTIINLLKYSRISIP